jgi:hypothetical protein
MYFMTKICRRNIFFWQKEMHCKTYRYGIFLKSKLQENPPVNRRAFHIMKFDHFFIFLEGPFWHAWIRIWVKYANWIRIRSGYESENQSTGRKKAKYCSLSTVATFWFRTSCNNVKKEKIRRKMTLKIIWHAVWCFRLCIKQAVWSRCSYSIFFNTYNWFVPFKEH